MYVISPVTLRVHLFSKNLIAAACCGLYEAICMLYNFHWYYINTFFSVYGLRMAYGGSKHVAARRLCDKQMFGGSCLY